MTETPAPRGSSRRPGCEYAECGSSVRGSAALWPHRRAQHGSTGCGPGKDGMRTPHYFHPYSKDTTAVMLPAVF